MLLLYLLGEMMLLPVLISNISIGIKYGTTLTLKQYVSLRFTSFGLSQVR